MRIRSKVILFSLLFAVSSGVVMAWCFINVRREEMAFLNGRRAMKTFAAVTDIEYFFVRQVRLLESYVLLGDESERLQLVQVSAQARQRLEEWAGAVKKGEAHGDEIPAVQSVSDAIGLPANKIRGLIAQGKRVQAMALVEKEFSPNSRRALIKFDGIKRRVQNAKVQSENTVVRELQRNHLGLMGGLGLVVFFGLAFLWALAHAVIRPIQNMRAWADRVARGEKGLAMTAFSGKNELTELAQSIGEMAIQLTRPKAYPPPLPEPKAPPKLPAVPVPPVSAPKIPAPETPPVLSPAALRSVSPPPIAPPSPPPAPETALHEWAIPQMPSTSASTVPAQALPDLPPPSPPAKDDLDEAVSEFREILALMGKKEPPKPRRKP